MFVNKDNAGEQSTSAEPDGDRDRPEPVAAPARAALGQLVVLDDLAPPMPRQLSLSQADLKLLRALQAILEKRQSDAWIDEMRAQISMELEWNEM